MQIEIDVKDNRAFAHIAFLVDRQDFIEQIKTVRKTFKLAFPFPQNLIGLQKHFITVAGLNSKDYIIDPATQANNNAYDFLFEDLERLLQYFIENQDYLDKNEQGKVIDLETSVIEAVKDIRQKFEYAPIFDSVIFQAIVFNRITYFKTAYATIINQPAYSFEADDDLSVKRNAMLAVIVTPYSTTEDIEKAVNKCKNDLVNLLGNAQYHDYKNLPNDTISNIRRNREWYWSYTAEKLRNPKIGYGTLAKQAQVNVQTYRTAVNDYKNLLTDTV